MCVREPCRSSARSSVLSHMSPSRMWHGASTASMPMCLQLQASSERRGPGADTGNARDCRSNLLNLSHRSAAAQPHPPLNRGPPCWVALGITTQLGRLCNSAGRVGNTFARRCQVEAFASIAKEANEESPAVGGDGESLRLHQCTPDCAVASQSRCS